MSKTAIIVYPNGNEKEVSGDDFDYIEYMESKSELLCPGKNSLGKCCRAKMRPCKRPHKNSYYFASDGHIKGCSEYKKKTTRDMSNESLEKTSLEDIIGKAAEKESLNTHQEGNSTITEEESAENDSENFDINLVSRSLRNVNELFAAVKDRPLDDCVCRDGIRVGDLLVDARNIESIDGSIDSLEKKLFILKRCKPPFDRYNNEIILVDAFHEQRNGKAIYIIADIGRLISKNRKEVWEYVKAEDNKKKLIVMLGNYYKVTQEELKKRIDNYKGINNYIKISPEKTIVYRCRLNRKQAIDIIDEEQ